jgi:hypothetical protein
VAIVPIIARAAVISIKSTVVVIAVVATIIAVGRIIAIGPAIIATAAPAIVVIVEIIIRSIISSMVATKPGIIPPAAPAGPWTVIIIGIIGRATPAYIAATPSPAESPGIGRTRIVPWIIIPGTVAIVRPSRRADHIIGIIGIVGVVIVPVCTATAVKAAYAAGIIIIVVIIIIHGIPITAAIIRTGFAVLLGIVVAAARISIRIIRIVGIGRLCIVIARLELAIISGSPVVGDDSFSFTVFVRAGIINIVHFSGARVPGAGTAGKPECCGKKSECNFRFHNAHANNSGTNSRVSTYIYNFDEISNGKV